MTRSTPHKGHHLRKRTGKIIGLVFALLALWALYVGLLVFFILKAIHSGREIATAKAAGTPLDPRTAPNEGGYTVGAVVWGFIFGFITLVVSAALIHKLWEVIRNKDH